MSYGGNHRCFAGENGSGKHFIVECGKVIGASASSPDYNYIGLYFVILFFQRADKLLGCVRSLNGNRREHQLRQRPPPPQNIYYVVQRRAVCGGNNTDFPGKTRKRLFRLRRKESFLFKALLELLKGEKLRSESVRLYVIDVQLAGAGLFVNG